MSDSGDKMSDINSEPRSWQKPLPPEAIAWLQHEFEILRRRYHGTVKTWWEARR